MVIHNDADIALRRIDKYFKLKSGSISDTNIYLGSKFKKINLENGLWARKNIQALYVKESVANVEKYLVELGDACWQLPKNKADNPFAGYFAPDMDKTPALEQQLA